MSKEHFNDPIGDYSNSSKESIKLCDEWERQIGKNLKLGFHRQLNLSIEEYLSTIPQFQIPQEELSGGFDKLLLVEPRISPKTQLILAGYEYSIRGLSRDNVRLPDKNPYLAVVQEYNGKDLREFIKTDDRGATLQEGAALLLAYPEVLNQYPVALSGSTVFSLEGEQIHKKIPCIYRWSDGKIGIGSDVMGYLEDDGARPVSCTRIR